MRPAPLFATALKAIKIFEFKGFGNLQCTVTTEIHHHHRITINNLADWLIIGIHQNKSGQILINNIRSLLTEIFDSFQHAMETICRLAMNHDVPASFHLRPIIVAIHNNPFATTT